MEVHELFKLCGAAPHAGKVQVEIDSVTRQVAVGKIANFPNESLTLTVAPVESPRPMSAPEQLENLLARAPTPVRIVPSVSGLLITVIDDAGPGGANHEYVVTWPDSAVDAPGMAHAGGNSLRIKFQKGPVPEGRNGVTQEDLLQIVEDRLACFQEGPFACEENDMALAWVRAAVWALRRRTDARRAQGVEGKNVPHLPDDAIRSEAEIIEFNAGKSLAAAGLPLPHGASTAAVIGFQKGAPRQANIPPAPPVDNDHVAEGCERFTGTQASAPEQETK